MRENMGSQSQPPGKKLYSVMKLVVVIPILLFGAAPLSLGQTTSFVETNSISLYEKSLTPGAKADHVLKALLHKDPFTARHLLLYGAPVNEYKNETTGDTALLLSSSSYVDIYADVVKILIDGGANVNAHSNVGDTPLH